MSESTKNFIEHIIENDLAAGRRKILTRFPPEPNGYLHIGHAKSITLNFTLAQQYGGQCNLRFDDTNPTREEMEFVESIKQDVAWLGFDWGDREFYASDYFERLYEFAEFLISKDKAYVDSLSPEQIREYRGTPTEPGRNSPYRDRPVQESLDLFRRMRKGEFAEGEHVLRAKIDMAHPNLNMRDPSMYRIRHAAHHRTGSTWCIYPMYDFAHGQSDAIEGISHSICTLEFENHRPLYDWFLKELELPDPPHQYEFARLNLTYTVLSKRKLRELVEQGIVESWDDPRMPTISGMRRRGYPPEAIVAFCRDIGVSKTESTIDAAHLLFHIREHLNRTAARVMAVLDPVKVVITNYPAGQTEEFVTENNPEDPAAGTRIVPFSRELYIEREDFIEEPPKKWFRLSPGREVRLKNAYYITCDEVVRDADGTIVELRCSYDPESRGGSTPDGRKVKGTLHWVSAAHAVPVEVHNYDHLFCTPFPENPGEGGSYLDNLNPDSRQIVPRAWAEPSLQHAESGQRFQFLRKGYYCVDIKLSKPGFPVFNRTVTLRDTWAKVQKNS
ncbi:glutamine--tRNA ligase/YqeY domain fusion protein [Spirochaeta africana]|uniref:Glutamine--tRNA ligase n=1 Tax=Spirochaeta africana (strain ATCC 700263 / DSM 8902 / Z-7692) TaxID=889378 RepID=H9UKR7_SPIAZ|nr:glutamine--tRNA ligase/YqeY domain fusion protein [Spirochaeta africana]AFG38110.1 glutaminyl-tRNA synthetase [Spirochaeta africana DSM 8902]